MEQNDSALDQAAQAGLDAHPPDESEPPVQSGMGLGMRMATDMVVATLIGVGMGYYLDQWLGTRPWMLLLFFLFGSVAGFRAVYRVASAKSPSQP